MCLREPSRELATNSCSRYFYKHLLGAWYRAWSRDTKIAKQTWLDDLFIPISPYRKRIHKYDTLPFREIYFQKWLSAPGLAEGAALYTCKASQSEYKENIHIFWPLRGKCYYNFNDNNYCFHCIFIGPVFNINSNPQNNPESRYYFHFIGGFC